MSYHEKPKHEPYHWRNRLHEVIFEADTSSGKVFDLVLICCILLSVAGVMLDSIEEYREKYAFYLKVAEWLFTGLFTVEYILRLICLRRPMKYATSFYGVIDLLAILPSYINLLLPGTKYLLVLRILRVIRVFRVLKLVQYVEEARTINKALMNARRKIGVFFCSVLSVMVVFGALMYLIEGEANGFTSIPRSIYWAIVTVTTVGYGDISPQTPLGQAIASFAMIVGYSIIAVPTGIVTVEMTRARKSLHNNTQACPACSAEGHDDDAEFCKYCGAKL
ncbi:MAG: ion transporter [Candidatus Sumerlaeia bacterium]